MPLTPPPNYTQAVTAVCIGVSLALLTGLLTRSTLPVVGDLQHNLPHGGRYRDGTKCIEYRGPGKLNSVESRGTWGTQPWLLVIVLVGAIILLSKRGVRRCQCGTTH
ncbi:triple gene block protein 2 [Blueberry virus S]|uniref:Movement protein TGB2 n=1 Tax=Blueberry virus S TaxID=2967988 RepID=A0AAE9N5Z5_9VIRU|nr:triple gene block protein 2 [Blueberry virus S]